MEAGKVFRVGLGRFALRVPGLSCSSRSFVFWRSLRAMHRSSSTSSARSADPGWPPLSSTPLPVPTCPLPQIPAATTTRVPSSLNLTTTLPNSNPGAAPHSAPATSRPRNTSTTQIRSSQQNHLYGRLLPNSASPESSSTGFQRLTSTLPYSPTPHQASFNSTGTSSSRSLLQVPNGVNPSRYLLTVIPPQCLPHDPPHPRISPTCTGYGPPHAFR